MGHTAPPRGADDESRSGNSGDQKFCKTTWLQNIPLRNPQVAPDPGKAESDEWENDIFFSTVEEVYISMGKWRQGVQLRERWDETRHPGTGMPGDVPSLLGPTGPDDISIAFKAVPLPVATAALWIHPRLRRLYLTPLTKQRGL